MSQLPSNKPISRESEEWIRNRRKAPPFAADGFDFDLLRYYMGMRQDPAGMPVKCLKLESEAVAGEWIVPDDLNPDFCLFYIHGGGYISGDSGFYAKLAARIAIAARCAVFMPNYRLAPEHRFPAAFEDCLQAYQWLVTPGKKHPV